MTEEDLASSREAPIDELCINTIRTLSMDAVEQADSGHPGAPMGLAPVVYVLWQNFLRYDPDEPMWPNRDRFVLSNGHASMLLYAMLHLAGVKAADAEDRPAVEPAVTLDDIKRFRQLGSRCPGHPGISSDHRRRNDHRTARSGLRNQRRHGDRRALVGATLQSAGLHSVRLRRLYAVR